MIKAIVYTSNTGFTKKYAEMLGEEIAETIIIKNVIPKQQYPFKVINGALVNKKAFEREKDKEER